MRALATAAALVALGWPSLAHAGDPCRNAVSDPAPTPVRDVDLDAQRSACPRQDVSARIAADALVDTPGFHGVLGGELILGGRAVLDEDYELSVQLHLVDYTYVQNAVNKVTNTAFGPIVIGGLRSIAVGTRTRGALAGRLELPYTGDPMDTFRLSGAVDTLVSHAVAPRLIVHGRLGAHAMYASSLAGITGRIALRAGGDVTWQTCSCFALQAGADASAGWQRGFDHVLVRAGVHWRFARRDWRLRAGLAAPLGGDERTNAILDVGVIYGM